MVYDSQTLPNYSFPFVAAFPWSLALCGKMLISAVYHDMHDVLRIPGVMLRFVDVGLK